MKTLITISALLVVATTNLYAQKRSAIEIKNLERKEINCNDRNEFKLYAHEELEVDLNFNLTHSEFNFVVISDDQNEVVFSKIMDKKGKNKIFFTTQEEKEYTVKLYSDKDINLVALTNRK